MTFSSALKTTGISVRLGMEGEIIAPPGESDDSVSKILDEGTAFTGDLPILDDLAGRAE